MKKFLLLLLMLVLSTGCMITRTDSMTNKEMVDKILSLDIDLYNEVGKGYKYYAPKGVVKIKAEDYNDVLKRNNVTYYLYVDVVSYYYKVDYNYKKSKNSYYYLKLNHDGKTGYVNVETKDDKLYVQMMYNYAKIEAYVDEKDLKMALEDMSYILSSVNFNDSLLKKMQEQGTFGSKEEVYKLFDNKEKSGNFLQYIKEFDKYDGDDTPVAEEEEIKVNDTTTSKSDE